MAKMIVSGKNSVFDAVNNGAKIERLILEHGKKIDNFKGKIEFKSKFEMNKISSMNHQGYIAVLDNFNFVSLEEIVRNQEPIIILDHIQDPHNFGALLRTLNAFNIKNVIFPKDRAVQISESVLNISSGGFINMNLCKVNSLSAAITTLKKNNRWIYASNLSSNSVDMSTISFDKDSVVILGSEDKGVSQTIQNMADVSFVIKTSGTVQSLNVSVAGGIIFHKIFNDINK